MLLSVKRKATPGRKRQSIGTEWRMQVLAFFKIRDNSFLDFFDNGIASDITVSPCRFPSFLSFCSFGQESSTLFASQIVALLRSDARAQAGSIFSFVHCIFFLAPHPTSTTAANMSNRCIILMDCRLLFCSFNSPYQIPTIISFSIIINSFSCMKHFTLLIYPSI